MVSGLRTPSISEDLLESFLIQKGLQPTSSILSVESANGHKIPVDAAVIFILPILGDNDLLPFQASELDEFLTTQNLAGRKVILVLKGDRHASDEFVLEKYPVHVKLRHIFRSITSLAILDTKLDQDTAERIACRVSHELEEALPSPCKELDLLAGLLGRAPAWDPELKQLDFDDGASSYSLLYKISRPALEEVVRLSKSLHPQSLVINHAHMQPPELEIFSNISTVKKVQLSSNNLTLDDVLSAFPSCRWVSLAANQLEVFSLAKSGPMLESVLVHKNNLRELILEPLLPCQLKRLSIYRNQISSFEWPANQSSLEVLNLGANPLTQLPISLVQAQNLKFLGLARTEITHLPDWIFSLPSLKEVDISHIEDRLPVSQIAKLLEMGVHLIKKPK